MCEYCDRKSLEADSLVPIIDRDFNIFGDTFMEICTALGIDDNGEIEEEVYLSNFCMNYHHRCYRKWFQQYLEV